MVEILTDSYNKLKKLDYEQLSDKDKEFLNDLEITLRLFDIIK